MEHLSEKRYPVSSKDYKLYEEVGEGVSATVYRALCIPLNEIVAIKVLDLEKCNNDLDGIRREVQTISLIDHPNVLRAHCSFTTDCSLWVVMPYMAGGSCLHIMKSSYPEGFEEPVIATLLCEVLKALVYLHSHGYIHRDVKAGNILIDANGSVKLADFGVSACMFDAGDRQRSRNTFVGTPCWMAPEVMQQLHGYDFKADIWSFGITALELAHGHAPFSKYPPMKVLLMTLQNAPPGLDYERDKRFSKSFKEMVATCLVKDPKKRLTSAKLLKHHFFKHARSNEYLTRTILNGLRPLGERFRMLKLKEADFLVQNKVMYGDKEQLSQQEYIRGISGWNFNLEDLKTQAALIEECDGISNIEDPDTNSKKKNGSDGSDFVPNMLSPKKVNHPSAVPVQKDGFNDLQNAKGSLASFPIRPLEALKGYFDVCEDDVNGSSPNCKDVIQSDSEQVFQLQQSSQAEDQETERHNGDVKRSSSLPKNIVIPGQCQRFFSGSLLPEHAVSSSRKVVADGDRENLRQKYPSEQYYSGPLSYRQKRDINNYASANMHSLDDTSEGTVVQQKGRFKVTSADVGPKGSPPNCSVNTIGQASTNSTIVAASLLPSLQYLLQQNALQREQLIKLTKCAEQTSGHRMEIPDAFTSDLPQLPPAPNRERELESQVLHLQQRIESIAKELQMLKMKNAQLERQLNALVWNKEEEERTWRENKQ
ncbi:serine/threonine-protein kinase BLUS1-like isoform X4 [Magnolia sinica]|uniref:serine/threonine-protein kinase BLUS1-like isoform X4 n=1 Tax=Magnolia sinica TaxID=86752 RepID=UPI0026588608|nr:serine/threonine-protein kinase BLUS1-like isoform X4 [Magnolia sinica]